MATGDWVADLDKKEHKNWVMVGCALNIAKNGITSKIQKEMESWYQSLISSPPLQSLPSCTCAPGAPKCASCVTWESELTRHHMSPKPRIFWNNTDRKQWGSPTGAWEIAKIFMPTLGSRKMDAIDAETTDIGGLLNLLEWCPFISPPVNRTVLSLARDTCRNHWAHAPKQEIEDADVATIFGHLNNLLSEPVFNADKAAQKALNELQELFKDGLVNIRNSEVDSFHLLRQELTADLIKFQVDLSDLQKFNEAVQKDLSNVKEQGDLNREEIGKLSTKVSDVENAAQKDLSEVKKQSDLNNEETEKLREAVEAVQRDLTEMKKRSDLDREEISKLRIKVSEVVNAAQKDLSEIKKQSDLNKDEVDKLREADEAVQRYLTEVKEQSDLDREEIGKLSINEDENAAQKDLSEVKEQVDLNREEIEKLGEELETKLRTVEEKMSNEISPTLDAVVDFNRQLITRADLRHTVEVISVDVEELRRDMRNVIMELNATKLYVANLQEEAEPEKKPNDAELKVVTFKAKAAICSLQVEHWKLEVNNIKSDIATLESEVEFQKSEVATLESVTSRQLDVSAIPRMHFFCSACKDEVEKLLLTIATPVLNVSTRQLMFAKSKLQLSTYALEVANERFKVATRKLEVATRELEVATRELKVASRVRSYNDF